MTQRSVGLSSQRERLPEFAPTIAAVGEGASQMFTVTTSAAGGACLGEAHVITVSGAENGAARAELEHALETVYADGGRNVAVDISALESVDGALDVLLLHLARFRARGGDVVVACGDEPSVKSELRIERRIDDAVASLLVSERPGT